MGGQEETHLSFSAAEGNGGLSRSMVSPVKVQTGAWVSMMHNPLQYSCLENPMGLGAWRAAVHGVARSRTRLSDSHTHTHTHTHACTHK